MDEQKKQELRLMFQENKTVKITFVDDMTGEVTEEEYSHFEQAVEDIRILSNTNNIYF